MKDRIDPRYISASQSIGSLGELVVPHYKLRRCWYHDVIAEVLDGLIRYVRYEGKRGGYARACISMPPQHGKSLHGRELLPAMALGLNPDLKVIATSKGAELAKEGLSHMRAMVNHPDYKETFSTRFGKEEMITPDGDRRVIQAVDKATLLKTLRPKNPRDLSMGYEPADGYYLAQGMDGSVTGWGYQLGIMDDLIKNDMDANSPAFYARLWSFYTSVFATRGSRFSAQLYIGTRWTEPDFADELVDFWRESMPGEEHLIRVVRFPAIAENPLGPDDAREPGEGLDICPACKSVDSECKRCHGGTFRGTEFYANMRAALLKRTPWVWWGLWQQAPRGGGAKMFQPECWLPFDHTFDLGKLFYVDFSIDPNLSEKGASFAVISVIGVMIADERAREDAGEHYFMLDEARGHWSWPEFCAEFEHITLKWRTELPYAVDRGKVWVEEKALGPALMAEYEHGPYNFEPVPKAASKHVCHRLASKVASPERKRVRIPMGTWGRDPVDPSRPLITDEWVGSVRDKGSWVHEMASQGQPDDRQDSFSQEIICRDPSLGKHLLNIRS